jgi:hypothetical protein
MQNFAFHAKFFYTTQETNKMTTLRQTCAVTILCLAFAVSAFAGQISSPGVVAPPPPPNQATMLPSDDLATTMMLTIISFITIF